MNLVRYDDPKEKYVYVQTLRDYHKFIDPILKKAELDPAAGHAMSGTVLLSSYFPIPWVLGDFPNIGYYTSKDNWPDKLDADFIAVDADKATEVEKRLKDLYFTTDFLLRDGMDGCRAYFRSNTFQDVFPGRQPEFEPGQSHE